MNKIEKRINKDIELLNENNLSSYLFHEYDNQIVISRISNVEEREKCIKKLIKDKQKENYMGYYIPLIYNILTIGKKSRKKIIETIIEVEKKWQEEANKPHNKKYNVKYSFIELHLYPGFRE